MKILRNYQPELFGVIVAIGALNVWYLSAMAVEEAVLPRSYDYFIRALTIIIGAFIGAFSAFWLKQYEEGKISLREQKVALNSALFVLIRQMNAIAGIKRDFDRYTNPLDRAFSLPAMKPPDYSDVRQYIDSLHFLIDKDEPQLLLDLSIEQERFEQAINAVNIRNNFYVNEVQPALSHHRLNGRPLPVAEFEEKLGEYLFQGAINGAETMYELVYASEHSLNQAYTALREQATKLFPGERFIAWKPM